MITYLYLVQSGMSVYAIKQAVSEAINIGTVATSNSSAVSHCRAFRIISWESLLLSIGIEFSL